MAGMVQTGTTESVIHNNLEAAWGMSPRPGQHNAPGGSWWRVKAGSRRLTKMPLWARNALYKTKNAASPERGYLVNRVPGSDQLQDV